MSSATPSFRPDCDFCRIVHTLEPAQVVCETEDCVAFFPLEPAVPGHTLIVPRVHVEDLWKADEQLGASLMAMVIRVGRAVQVALRPEGMNLITSAGEAASQTVFHLHLHVVPRRSGDPIGNIWGNIWPPSHPLGKTLEHDLAERVRAACREVQNLRRTAAPTTNIPS